MTTFNPVLDFGIDKSALRYIGADLQRPECILAEPDGTLWTWTGPMGHAHKFESYEGDHGNRIKGRFAEKVLPFFSSNPAKPK